MVEHLHGMQGVRSSSLLSSTIIEARNNSGLFFMREPRRIAGKGTKSTRDSAGASDGQRDPWLDFLFAGSFVPVGFALCNGQQMPVAANEALFSIIGVTYGGDGTKVFALPNMPAPVKGLS